MARNRRKKHRRWWPGNLKEWSKFPQLPKFMPTRSSNTSRKTSFCCSDAAIMMTLCTLFFPITHNDSHLWTIISRRPWSHRKSEIYIIEEFCCRLYLCQNHKCKKNCFFSIFKQRTNAYATFTMAPDNHAIVKVAFQPGPGLRRQRAHCTLAGPKDTCTILQFIAGSQDSSSQRVNNTHIYRWSCLWH